MINNIMKPKKMVGEILLKIIWGKNLLFFLRGNKLCIIIEKVVILDIYLIDKLLDKYSLYTKKSFKYL